MSESFDAVLLDMDGVTVETAATWRRIEAEQILPRVTEGDVPTDAIRALSPRDAYDRLVEMDGVTVTVDYETYDRLFDERAETVYREQATLMDGYRQLLTTIRAQELATGLVSASCRAWVDMVLDRFDLASAYDTVVSATDIDGPSKPAPLAYQRAAADLGTDPEHCLAVEDTPHGIRAAVDAGAHCIAIEGDGNESADLSAADDIVESPAALRRTIRSYVEPDGSETVRPELYSSE